MQIQSFDNQTQSVEIVKCVGGVSQAATRDIDRARQSQAAIDEMLDLSIFLEDALLMEIDPADASAEFAACNEYIAAHEDGFLKVVGTLYHVKVHGLYRPEFDTYEDYLRSLFPWVWANNQ